MHNPPEAPKDFPPEEKGSEGHPSWPVSFDEKGRLLGLPPDKTEKDVIVFKGNDGKWYAQNPSSELLEELGQWRTDWRKKP